MIKLVMSTIDAAVQVTWQPKITYSTSFFYWWILKVSQKLNFDLTLLRTIFFVFKIENLHNYRVIFCLNFFKVSLCFGHDIRWEIKYITDSKIKNAPVGLEQTDSHQRVVLWLIFVSVVYIRATNYKNNLISPV